MTMPPFLLAAALAFWGWRTGNYAAAAGLALLAEAPRFIKLRFDLQQGDFTKIATLCTAAFVALLAWLFLTLDGPRTARAVLTTLLWMPAVLSPLLLAQQLSTAGRVPLSSLFRYLRKLRERDPTIPDPAIDLSSVYFAICVVGAGIPNRRDEVFYFAAAALIAWALAAFRPKHASWPAWAAALVLACGLGFGAHRGLGELQAALEDWITAWVVAGLGADPYRASTDLGSVGRLKMVETIVLRVYAQREEAERMRLLHRASFTSLYGRTWVARGAPMKPLQPLADGTTWPLAPGDAEHSTRIVTRLERGKALLALPSGTLRLSSMPAATVRSNTLGAIEAELGGDWAPYVAELAPDPGGEYAPPGAADLQIPDAERAVLEQAAAEAGLRAGMPAQEALRRVREYLGGFAYSTYRDAAVPLGATPLGDFLRNARSGHCEYFAAASTLLLRVAGVPARYATGFAMVEYSALEEAYVVRARHAHAWTRAYVDGRWMEVDTTPPSWVEEEAASSPAWQRFADFLRWAGFRWSQRAGLEGSPFWYGLAALLFVVFAWRVLRGKRAARASAAVELANVPRHGTDSEFFDVERRLAARFSPRGPAEPPAMWLGRLALDPSTMAGMERLLELHCRYRFDPEGISTAERGDLRSGCAALAAALD